jgi:hypothetical protein
MAICVGGGATRPREWNSFASADPILPAQQPGIRTVFFADMALRKEVGKARTRDADLSG